MKSYEVDLASTWCMMRYYNYMCMCSHSLRQVLNQSDDLRDDGYLFHSGQAFGTKEKRYEFVCEKCCRYMPMVHSGQRLIRE